MIPVRYRHGGWFSGCGHCGFGWKGEARMRSWFGGSNGMLVGGQLRSRFLGLACSKVWISGQVVEGSFLRRVVD
jgi:hypothetical protein